MKNKILQPEYINERFKDKKFTDHLGWTGTYILSAKDIIDVLIDFKDSPEMREYWFEKFESEINEGIEYPDKIKKWLNSRNLKS